MEKMQQMTEGVQKIAEIFSLGIDVITSEYIWDKQETTSYIENERRLLDQLILQRNSWKRIWSYLTKDKKI